jgi:hypothetical protein
MIKKFLLLVLYTCPLMANPVSFPYGIRHDETPIFCPELKKVLAPNVTLLTKQTLEKKESFSAHSIVLDCSDGPNFFHIGLYCGGKILTRFGRSYNDCIMPPLGEQTILFSSGESIVSNEWSIEEDHGVFFVIHYYTDFKIYTNKQTQFVVYN